MIRQLNWLRAVLLLLMKLVCALLEHKTATSSARICPTPLMMYGLMLLSSKHLLAKLAWFLRATFLQSLFLFGDIIYFFGFVYPMVTCSIIIMKESSIHSACKLLTETLGNEPDLDLAPLEGI